MGRPAAKPRTLWALWGAQGVFAGPRSGGSDLSAFDPRTLVHCNPIHRTASGRANKDASEILGTVKHRPKVRAPLTQGRQGKVPRFRSIPREALRHRRWPPVRGTNRMQRSTPRPVPRRAKRLDLQALTTARRRLRRPACRPGSRPFRPARPARDPRFRYRPSSRRSARGWPGRSWGPADRSPQPPPSGSGST